MKALGIGFEDRVEPFAKAVNYDEFRAFSPTGQVPALLHEGRTIYDSLGITLYLADRHDGVWPVDEAARAWAQCAVAEMHSGFSALRNACTINVGVRVRPRPHAPAVVADVGRIRELGKRGFPALAGPGWPVGSLPQPMLSLRRSPFACALMSWMLARTP